MIDQQSGISLESLLRGILGIVTVLAVAYALSYDRKRIDWKLIGGGLIMQVIFALAVLYIPFVGTALEWMGKTFIKLFRSDGLYPGGSWLFIRTVRNQK